MSIEEKIGAVLKKCEDNIKRSTTTLIEDIEKETREVLNKVLAKEHAEQHDRK